MKTAVHALIPVLLGFPAMAQEEPLELSTMVVQAYRFSVLPPHFAGSSTVIDEETIAKSGVRSVADLLAIQGGIRITSSSGNTSDGAVHLRGFGENSSSRVLILVDGRPMNRPDMASVSLLEVPLSRIARVEILRGSQTARYGDNAVGGVINLVTKAAGKPRTILEAAGGSDGYSLVRLAHDGRYAGNGLSFDLEHNFTDGWRDNAVSELESAGLRWDREISQGNEVRAGIAWADEYTQFPGPLSKEQYEKNPRQSIYSASGDGDQYFSQQTTWRGEGGVMIGKGSDLTIDFPFTASSRDLSWNLGPGSHADNLLNSFTFMPVARLSKERWSAEVGLNGRRDELSLDQYAEIRRKNKTADAGLTREVAGIFSAVEWEPWDGLHLNTSARWEKSRVDAEARSLMFPEDESLNFSRGNDEINRAFQMGVRWEPTNDVSAWVRYDRLYRLPSTDEIASYQGYPLSVPFNDQLRAETGNGVELGGEYALSSWTFRSNVFYQRLDGEIAYDYIQNLNVNFADTQRLGTEADVGYQGLGWEVNLHYTYLEAEFCDGPYSGKSVYLVPNHELSALLAVHPHEKVTVQGEYQYIGSSYEGNDFLNENEKLPAYGVANLLVRYEPTPSVSLYLRVNNLWDESYATVKYSGVWYPAAGRTFQCGIRHEF